MKRAATATMRPKTFYWVRVSRRKKRNRLSSLNKKIQTRREARKRKRAGSGPRTTARTARRRAT